MSANHGPLRLSQLFFIVVAILLTNCSPKTETITTLTVHISGHADTSGVVLEELRGKYLAFDTASVHNEGVFTFHKPIERQSFFRLKLANGQTVPLILGPNQSPVLRITGDNAMHAPAITGSPETSALFRSNNIARALQNDLAQIAFVFADTTRAKPLLAEKDSLLAKADSALKQRRSSMRALLNDNATNLSALPILLQKTQNHTFFSPDSDKTLFIDIDKHLIKNYGYHPQVRKFHYQLDSVLYNLNNNQGARVGDAMPDPMVKTIWQEHLPISKFKGNPLLVVVWSSLDEESEQSLPLIKSLWEQYNPKGLAVYMISTDSTQTIWQRAIEQYRLACIHANDLQGSTSPLFQTLGIHQIPATFLVNKDGIIIEKNIWGEQLQDAVKKQLEPHTTLSTPIKK